MKHLANWIEIPVKDLARAQAFYQGLEERRLNVLHHVRKIVALGEIYGTQQTARAIQDALEFGAFSCEYIANILEQRRRPLPEPGALHLTRRQDLLDLELPEPNLDLYDNDPAPDPPDPAPDPTDPDPAPDPDLDPNPGETHEP